jgi:hypothetical protein
MTTIPQCGQACCTLAAAVDAVGHCVGIRDEQSLRVVGEVVIEPFGDDVGTLDLESISILTGSGSTSGTAELLFDAGSRYPGG